MACFGHNSVGHDGAETDTCSDIRRLRQSRWWSPPESGGKGGTQVVRERRLSGAPAAPGRRPSGTNGRRASMGHCKLGVRSALSISSFNTEAGSFEHDATKSDGATPCDNLLWQLIRESGGQRSPPRIAASQRSGATGVSPPPLPPPLLPSPVGGCLLPAVGSRSPVALLGAMVGLRRIWNTDVLILISRASVGVQAPAQPGRRCRQTPRQTSPVMAICDTTSLERLIRGKRACPVHRAHRA